MVRDKIIKFRGTRSQEEMGNMYDVSQQTWSNWECGIKKPSVSRMKQMETDSGIPMEELFPDIFNNHKLFGGKGDSQREKSCTKLAG